MPVASRNSAASVGHSSADPADQAAIIEVAKAIFQRFAAVFRSIPHVRETAHA